MSQATEIAQSGDLAVAAGAELEGLLARVGVGTLDCGWIRVAGADRVRWLNGMVTNSIQELGPGEGNYSFVLNAQGRIQGDLWAFVGEKEDLLVETGRERVAGLMALFDRFIIMDEVELEDVSAGRVGFAVVGPGAEALLDSVGLAVGGRVRTVVSWRGGWVEVIAGHGPLVPRFEVWTDAAMGDALGEALGGVGVGPEAMEWLRVLEGTPRFGVDIREKELAQETMQTRALHFAKGCYLGQEIVERIRSRGAVHRQFGGFRLEGPLPSPGMALEVGGKVVGELTSVAAIPLGGGVVQYGLGYARREATEFGARLAYAGESGPGWAMPVPLPFELHPVAAIPKLISGT